MLNQKKLLALRETVKHLSDDTVKYQWEQQSHCNCGVLAQVISGKSLSEIREQLEPLTDEWCKIYDKKNGPSWKELLQEYCPISGTPVITIFKELRDCGFSNIDLKNLEFLSDNRIVAKAGIDSSKKHYYKDKSNLIKYLETWAHIIEEDEKNMLQLNMLVDQILAENQKEEVVLNEKLQLI